MDKLKNKQFYASVFLFLAFVLYVVSTVYLDVHSFFGYLKAFSEAAMVGGIADWFAITALFKHPLGLKIPHTAIIPKSKNKIGKNISNFIRENFLSEEYVRENIKKINFHEKAVILLTENKEKILNKFHTGIHNALKNIKYSQFEKYLTSFIYSKIETLNLNLLLLKTIDILVKKDYHQKIVDTLLYKTRDWLSDKENEKMVNDYIKNLIKKNEDGKNTFTGTIKGFFIGEPKLHKYMSTFIEQIEDDPLSKFRQKVDICLDQIIIQINLNKSLKEKIELIKKDILENINVEKNIQIIFEEVLIYIQKDFESEQSFMKKYISELFDELLLEFKENQTMVDWIKHKTETKIPEFIAQNAENIDNYFIEYLEKQDAKQISKLIEEKVGDDLQFIRINGTIIGGLIGLVIHSSTQLIRFLAI